MTHHAERKLMLCLSLLKTLQRLLLQRIKFSKKNSPQRVRRYSMGSFWRAKQTRDTVLDFDEIGSLGGSIMRLIPLIAAALSLFLSGPSFAQEWIDYASRADFFGVNFPGEPKVKDITYRTEYNITLPGRVHSYEDGSNRYSVTVVDYTNIEKLEAERVKKCQAAGGDGDSCNDHSSTDKRGAIIYATWNFIQRGSKVTHLAYSNADRVEGHELYLTNADRSRTFAAIYMHENRLYILEGTVPANSPPPALFYQSMGFLDKDGKRLRYQSPYSNGFPAPPRAR